MTKRKRPHRPSRGRTTPKGSRPRRQSRHHGPPIEEPPPFLDDVQQALEADSPFELMLFAAMMIEATTTRPADRWRGADAEHPDPAEFFPMLAESGWPEATVLAVAVAAMHPDELLAKRIRSAADPALLVGAPQWLATMREIEITGTWRQTEPLNDGENVLVSWRWPDGAPGSVIAYVDHNMGTIVKDAFVLPMDGDELVATYAERQDEYMTDVPIDPADARARLTEAIEQGEITVPPMETETWPICRPIIEWVLRNLPTNGTGYTRPDWPEADRQRLLDDFLASDHSVVKRLKPEQVRDLADPLIWFGCDYGRGDPLRWSPVSVEIVLTGWYDRKVYGLPTSQMKRLPDVLAGFVEFCHEQMEIPSDLTDLTIDAVNEWAPDFVQAIQDPDRSPSDDWDDDDDIIDLDDLFANIGLDDRELGDLAELVGALEAAGADEDEFVAALFDQLERTIVASVGGPEAYESLDGAPLADVPFDWSPVPDQIHDLTAETLKHLDQWASELFDDEVRTIARAALSGVIAADQSLFKRSARTDILAATVLVVVTERITVRQNRRQRSQMPWTVVTNKDLAKATGVSASAISSRSHTIRQVMGRADIDWPSLIHSHQRQEAIHTRELIAAWRSGNSS